MKKTFILLIILFFSMNFLYSQETKPEAIYIYNFARLLNWSENAGNDIFLIQVIDDINMVSEINYYAKNKPVYQQKVVAEISNINSIGSGQIIYLPTSRSELLPAILEKTMNKNILIITEKSDLVSEGACVSFLWQVDEVTGAEILYYQYNEKNIIRQNIKLSIEFKGFGIAVKNEE